MKLKDLIKKADVALFAVLVLIGLASLGFLISGKGSGSTVNITVDGKPYGSYPLSIDRVIDVDTVFGHNQITISGGKVWVSETNCSGHDCEHFGKISLAKQSIMCLPHKLIVSISGKSDVDIVLY